MARITAATVSRRQLYASMSKQLDGTPLQVGEHVRLQVYTARPKQWLSKWHTGAAPTQRADTNVPDAGAVATQGLQQSSLFTFEGSAVKPVLQRLDVPVRAIVAPFSDRAVAGKVATAVRRHLLPLMAPAGLWLQNNSMYHSTLWHASHHQASRHLAIPFPSCGYLMCADAAALQSTPQYSAESQAPCMSSAEPCAGGNCGCRCGGGCGAGCGERHLPNGGGPGARHRHLHWHSEPGAVTATSAAAKTSHCAPPHTSALARVYRLAQKYGACRQFCMRALIVQPR